ncbi:MAG: hypothetical protein IJ089_14180 [Clostridia bacterium]|nr:hypothetical protein [Clostridia bacterium]
MDLKSKGMWSSQLQPLNRRPLDRATSPEHLTEYLRVTNPSTWVILASVALLLVGLLVWASIGSLEMKAAVVARVTGQDAQVIAVGGDRLAAGMVLNFEEQKTEISSVSTDAFGRLVAGAHLELPDGVYNGTVILSSVHPISFLLGN